MLTARSYRVALVLLLEGDSDWYILVSRVAV